MTRCYSDSTSLNPSLEVAGNRENPPSTVSKLIQMLNIFFLKRVSGLRVVLVPFQKSWLGHEPLYVLKYFYVLLPYIIYVMQ